MILWKLCVGLVGGGDSMAFSSMGMRRPVCFRMRLIHGSIGRGTNKISKLDSWFGLFALSSASCTRFRRGCVARHD